MTLKFWGHYTESDVRCMLNATPVVVIVTQLILDDALSRNLALAQSHTRPATKHLETFTITENMGA